MDEANATHDTHDDEATGKRIKRQLLMGVALLLALLSVFAGVIEVGRVFELGFATLAAMCVLIALTIKPTGGATAPRETTATDETRRRDG
jgi:hypothetical protein